MTSTPGTCARVHWEMPGAPANGWDEITFPFTIYHAPDAAGWCFAQQYRFVGGNAGCCGVRPSPGGTNVVAFSVFGEGSRVVDDQRCRARTDGGAGASCSVDAPLVRNREYLITVYRESPGSRVWRGMLADGDTGHGMDLGAWALPHDGGITPSNVGIMEYCRPVESCAAVPLASLEFGAPYHVPTGATGRCHSPASCGPCNGRINYADETTEDGRVRVRCGWPARERAGERGTSPITVTVNVYLGWPGAPVGERG